MFSLVGVCTSYMYMCIAVGVFIWSFLYNCVVFNGRWSIHSLLFNILSFATSIVILQPHQSYIFSYHASSVILHGQLSHILSYPTSLVIQHHELSYILSHPTSSAILHPNLSCLISYPVSSVTLHPQLSCILSYPTSSVILHPRLSQYSQLPSILSYPTPSVIPTSSDILHHQETISGVIFPITWLVWLNSRCIIHQFFPSYSPITSPFHDMRMPLLHYSPLHQSWQTGKPCSGPFLSRGATGAAAFFRRVRH